MLLIVASGCSLVRSGLGRRCSDDSQCDEGVCRDGACVTLTDAGRRDAGEIDSGEEWDAGDADAAPALDGAIDAGTDAHFDAGAGVLLLDFGAITCARASPATFFDSDAGVLRTFAANEARILDDGALFVEGARRNEIPQSEDLSAWMRNASTLTVDASPAPDSSLSAELWEPVGREDAYLITTGAILPGGYGTVSLFAQSRSGAASFRQYFQSSATNQWSAARTVSSSWRRFTHTALDVSRNGVFQAVGASEPLAVALWGVQSEAGAFASQYIPTAGSGAGRAADVCSFPSTPPGMLAAPFALEIVPEASSLELLRSAQNQTLFEVGTLGQRLELVASGTVTITVFSEGGERVSSGPLSYNANQRLTIEVDPAAGSLTVQGAASGNGTFIGVAWSWTEGTLHVGRGAAGDTAYFGAIGRPRTL